MKKNTYSLILSENVVSEIDRLAHQLHTNRSSLINRILAEYVSYETPELKTEKVFDLLSAMLGSNHDFRIMPQPSANVFVLSTPLAYKYNPTVRYTVEIFRTQDDAAGNIKVSLRTRSDALVETMQQFFRLWSSLDEKGCCSENRFSRMVPSRQGFEPEECARELYDYVQTMDRAMKLFLAGNDENEKIREQIVRVFGEYSGKLHE